MSDDSSYKISDVSAEYNNAELNDKALALIPKENSNVPFAALDKVIKEEVPSKSPEKPDKDTRLGTNQNQRNQKVKLKILRVGKLR